MSNETICAFHTTLNKERENPVHYNTILKNGWQTNQYLMILSINYRNNRLSLFMLDNGYTLYDVVVFRKILSYNVGELIDKYLELGINLNDDRLYVPEIIEDYTYNYDDSDDSDNEEYKEPKLVTWEMESPVLFHTKDLNIIKKFVSHGINLDKNIYSSNKGGALKKAIDYGDMGIVEYYMTYLNSEYLENDGWWCDMLSYVSQNGNIGKGAEKCYIILCLREKLRGYPDRLPDRKIYDVVKHKWAYRVKLDPGEFRD